MIARRPSLAFRPAEQTLIRRLCTPRAVQQYLNALPYNTESRGETLRGFRGVVQTGTAHCLEAALFAAVILEQHGYPPLVLSFESVDHLDHVIFVYRRHGLWGSVARSRDPGLHGRKPVFRRPRDLASSYVDPYVDDSGAVTGYAVVNLADALGPYDWRLSERFVWKVERILVDHPHRSLETSAKRIARLRRAYVAFRAEHGGRKPVTLYRDRDRWTALPAEFREGGL